MEEILILSDRFEMEELKSFAQGELSRHLQPHQIWPLLELSERLNAAELKV